MNKKQMALLATAEFSESQIRGLSESQIRGLSASQIRGLSESQIRGLSESQISWLSISWLSESQISWLSESQISWLSESQISWLSESQISWLSASQLALINLKDVPFVANLYTQILSHIKADDWDLDQSTFGEKNRGKSVCESPMCIGGSTVWLAGAEGYKLADKFGYGGAALLIHRKSRPDVGAPRYDNYPNGWALAYIEERAKEEKTANSVS